MVGELRLNFEPQLVSCSPSPVPRLAPAYICAPGMRFPAFLCTPWLPFLAPGVLSSLGELLLSFANSAPGVLLWRSGFRIWCGHCSSLGILLWCRFNSWPGNFHITYRVVCLAPPKKPFSSSTETLGGLHDSSRQNNLAALPQTLLPCPFACPFPPTS